LRGGDASSLAPASGTSTSIPKPGVVPVKKKKKASGGC